MPTSGNGISHRLTNRVALVTGGARGQGAAHAYRLAGEGAVVFLADVLDDDGARTAEELRAKGLDATYLHLDVSTPDDWDAAYRLLDAKHGRLDILVNNAGSSTSPRSKTSASTCGTGCSRSISPAPSWG